ncbi:sulfatase-like hydrolase/transferase [Pseudodesulfovibrio sp. F-1]|uniref:Sulfatase-like hydrolase/transferase n=1 Tax=Pseudodesulfovibrio alkaliphilus TaxID=2661613 RepID=A0A7K1KPT2_9BACT|nr:sulfatase-like hydrolase/transferase [Pseudodesulfovibrio alkaliphilus]MUM78105.1 sulfatase-like hydrolase/transferase [Pseudodesulfovibrio alkaliphilus]
MEFKRKKRNIVWICIDGLRCDSFRATGNESVPDNYIDELMYSGAFFPNCIAAAQSTMPSSASFLTSLTPDLCRVPTQTANCIPQFHPDAVTLADILKYHGYRTYRWDDMNTYSCHPKSGFDVFEGGYGSLLETPNMSFDASERVAFLDRFKKHDEHKFLYMHLDHLHEYGGESASVWTGEKYLHHVQEVAEEVRSIVARLDLGDNGIILINSDHGVTLNEDFVVFEKRHGGSFAESRIRVPTVFHCKGIEPRVFRGVVGNIDLAPTLLDMVGIDDMKAMGVSLLPVMIHGMEHRGRPIEVQWAVKPNHPKHVIGGECPSGVQSVCLRDNDWKYTVYNDGKRMLVDMRPGAEDLVDALDRHPEMAARYDAMYHEIYGDRPGTPLDLYERTGMAFDKSAVLPEVSILMPIHRGGVAMRKALVSLIDQIGCFEILILDTDETGMAAAVCEDYDDDFRVRRIPLQRMKLGEMLAAGFEESQGDYIATVSPEYRYTEDFIYNLRRALESSPSSGFAYCDGYQFYQDPRGEDYYYMGPPHFYIGNCLNTGGVGSRLHFGQPDAQRLREFNFVGDVAFFTRELIERAGGFARGASLKKTWERMIRLTEFTHFPSPMIIANGPVGRPVMGIPEPQEGRKVSVLVAVENPVRLSILLNSLRGQTIRDFEVVMAAPEDQVAAIAAMAEGFPDMEMQLCVVNNTRNKASVHNTLLTHANGTYLTWCPAESILPETYLEALLCPVEAGSVFANGSILLSLGTSRELHKAKSLTPASLWMHPQSMTGLLYRRSLHEQIGMFHSKSGGGAPWDMLMRVVECGPGSPVPGAILFLNAAVPEPPLSDHERKIVYMGAMARMGSTIDLARLNYDIFMHGNSQEHVKCAVERFHEILQAVPMLGELNPKVVYCGSVLRFWTTRQEEAFAAETVGGSLCCPQSVP